jgi:hypothetical protein
MTGSEPPVMTPLGKFAIKTHLEGTYLTAVGGGGMITDVIHTNAVEPLRLETFILWADNAQQNYAFQTVNDHFLTAVNAGGMTSEAIHSDATRIRGWEMFKLVRQLQSGTTAIQTQKGIFLTAVGGGSHDSGETLHTDALIAREWESYNIIPLDVKDWFNTSR